MPPATVRIGLGTFAAAGSVGRPAVRITGKRIDGHVQAGRTTHMSVVATHAVARSSRPRRRSIADHECKHTLGIPNRGRRKRVICRSSMCQACPGVVRLRRPVGRARSDWVLKRGLCPRKDVGEPPAEVLQQCLQGEDDSTGLVPCGLKAEALFSKNKLTRFGGGL